MEPNYNSGTYTDSGGYVNPREDIAKSVIQTSDGGYALVGSASLFRASTSSVVYSSWVVKTDAKGKQSWNKGYDLLNEQGYPYFIIQTSDSGYAVAGTENGDFCLFKTTSTNQLQWSKTYGDTQTDSPCSIVQLEDGGYALAGTWDPSNATSLIRPTMGLLRTDSTGQLRWTRTYRAKENSTTFSSEQARAMIRTTDGSYAIVGDTQFGSEPHVDVFFVKTETLEQPPKTTPLPTPDTNESSDQTPQPPSNQTEPTTPDETSPTDDKTKPTANAGSDQTVKPGTTVTFDGSKSSDNVGIVSYTWTFTDVTMQTLNGVSPSYTFTEPGAYTITLNVKDAAGNEATDTMAVSVNEDGPFPTLLFAAAAAGIAIVATAGFLVHQRKRKTPSRTRASP